MKNREVYQRDPSKIHLLNNGVAAMTDALTEEERRTLRFELEHFVCEGEYKRGMVRVLNAYVSNMGQPEQQAAWISGFYGSGKSHLVKMLHYLWIDYTFPEDGASARGLARLPDDVKDLLKEVSILGKRHGGLHAASGTLGAGAGESVRLALLGIVFRSSGLPEGYPQACFCMWLKKNDIYDQVCSDVEESGRDFRKELSDLYVSPVIAKALLKVDPAFAVSEQEAKKTLREQFPKLKDISTEEFVQAMQDALVTGETTPCTLIILDEVQQYIGDDSNRSYIVQEVVEACSKRFGARLMFVGTGQTALSGMPALQRLQGRFIINVELSDNDVETVTRRVVLAKKADKVTVIEKILESNAGEINRQLKESSIGSRAEDRSVLVEDYPLLPVRRRFWERVLRTVDKAGTAGQLRTQLRIVYDAIHKTAEAPLGTVVPADFLFDEISPNLLQTGVLLKELDEVIRKQDDGTDEGRLKMRLCSLIFLIRKLPREAGSDSGVRATAEMLADLLVEDLASDGTALRIKLPNLLEELAAKGTLMKVDDEYSLQTRESSEWEQEFRNRETKLLNDLGRLASKRSQLLSAECQKIISSVSLKHGQSKVPRKLLLHFGDDAPPESKQDISVWIRDEWGVEEKSVLADARAAGPDSPSIHVFIAKYQATNLNKRIAEQDAAQGTINFKGVPTGREGVEARDAMQTRLTEATNGLNSLVKDIVDGAKVFQSGGNERLELTLPAKIQEAAKASLDRLFPDFGDADDARWDKVIQRARGGHDNPFEAVDFKDKLERHTVCAAIISHIGSGKKGKEIRSHFADAPFGWSRDAVDAALISLFASGHLSASASGVTFKPKELDQNKIPVADFRVETSTIGTKDRMKLRGLYQSAGISCKPNEESSGAANFLSKLVELANGAGGEPPLPERPKTDLIVNIESLAGNEQLDTLLNNHDVLKKNAEDWAKAKELSDKRLPVYRKLIDLLRHARGLDFSETIQTQVNAIVEERRLLAATDPLVDLVTQTVDGLRATLTDTESTYNTIYDQQMNMLEETEGWKKITKDQRDQILSSVGLSKVSKGKVGNEDEVLASLNRLSLEAWKTKTAALPQQFADARKQADKLLEPKTQHISLSSGTLRTKEDIDTWIDKTKVDLQEKIQKGPIVIA